MENESNISTLKPGAGHIHFIAIGGAVMHNLAIALKQKGYRVTGSDDEIFDPARSFLEVHGLLPASTGWYPEKIGPDTGAVILGMHARGDNPELLKARELGLKVYSFPEFMYEQTAGKKRVVIGGSHGKTTITSMVMHVLKSEGISFDYLVGSRLPGFATMVGLSEQSETAIFEGDEYLSSAMDPRPKFHLYRPHLALLSGISWDHMNVFPSFENYLEQFREFVRLIEHGGTLVYYRGDKNMKILERKMRSDLRWLPYENHKAITKDGKVFLIHGGGETAIQIFGEHNLQNISGARILCRELGIGDEGFYRATGSFTGAARRLEELGHNKNTSVFYDFAHAPSKVKATVLAVKQQFPGRELVACLELHTFSSLNPAFLPQYENTLNGADRAMVFFSPDTVAHKKLPPLSQMQVKKAFRRNDLKIFTDPHDLSEALKSVFWPEKNLLLMSSGNFGGTDIRNLTGHILSGSE